MSSGSCGGPADFDFLHGRWLVHHHRLRHRMTSCVDWDDFEGTMTCRPVLGGVGNVDEFLLPDLNAVGLTVRLFDRVDRKWSLHWASSTTGRFEPPVQGGFIDGIGTFQGEDVHEGRSILVRFTWDGIRATTARWQQAFSGDRGRTWEVNWIMALTRDSG